MSRYAKTFPCRYCGEQVTWQTAKSGRVYLAVERRINLRMRGESLSYPPHRCAARPEQVEA